MPVPVLHVPVLPASQSASASHAQLPAVHTNPGAHACPQAPQLVVLVFRSRHPKEQQVFPDEHADPPLQVQPFARQVSPRRQVPVVPEHWQRPDARSQVAPLFPLLHCESALQPQSEFAQTSPCC